MLSFTQITHSGWRVLLTVAVFCISVSCSASLKTSYNAKRSGSETTEEDKAQFSLTIVESKKSESGAMAVNWEASESLGKIYIILTTDKECKSPVMKATVSGNVTSYEIEIYDDRQLFICLFGERSSDGVTVAAINNGLAAEVIRAGDNEITDTVGAQGESSSAIAFKSANGATLTKISLNVPSMLYVGSSLDLVASGIFSDGQQKNISGSVEWVSSAPDILSIDESGKVAAVAPGSAIVSASTAILSASATVKVENPTLESIELSPTQVTLPLGVSKAFTATGIYSDGSKKNLTDSASWQSVDQTTATVTDKGMVTGKTLGSTLITAAFGTKSVQAQIIVKNATIVSIEVSPNPITLGLGASGILSATGVFSDNTNLDISESVVWSSSNSAVASVEKGVVKALAEGSVLVSAKLGYMSGGAGVAVLPAQVSSISITPSYPSVPKGSTKQYTAIATLTDNSTIDVTNIVSWSTSSPNVTINNQSQKGLAKAEAIGNAALEATLEGVVGQAGIKITPAVVSSITLSPGYGIVSSGSNFQFTATSNYSDGSTAVATTQVSWGSSSTAVATISNGGGTIGRASGVSPGLVTITGTLGSVSHTARLEVTSATLSSINITSSTVVFAKETKIAFKATGVYSDLSTNDLTSLVTWSSDATNIATVSNAGSGAGISTGIAAGVTTIRATMGAVSSSRPITVTNATLISLTVDQVFPQIANGQEYALTSSGVFSDASSQDMTISVNWSSDNPAIAAISNIAGKNGVVTPFELGPVVFVATFAGISASVNGQVVPGCEGSLVGGYCWYRTDTTAESCTDLCSVHGGYHTATRTYAGNEGTTANCQAVAIAVEKNNTITVSDTSGDGMGCYYGSSGGYYRVTDALTTAGATGSNRFCACQE